MPELPHVISLGAGVQSSTMALMAAHGEITPMPKAAIFADTQDEPASVYSWLDWLEKQLPFPVHRVTAGRLSEVSLRMRISPDGRRWTKTSIPFYLKNEDGSVGKAPFRGCTYDFKLRPLMKAARKLAAVPRGCKEVRVIQWVGISLDEMKRMKPSREPWAKCRWPLIELRMSRADCLEWMQRHSYPQPPRSACVFCPFHDREEWARMKANEPHEFERAVQFERDIQASKAATDNMTAVPYLHRTCKPLSDIDFSAIKSDQSKLWDDECEGMCGV